MALKEVVTIYVFSFYVAAFYFRSFVNANR